VYKCSDNAVSTLHKIGLKPNKSLMLLPCWCSQFSSLGLLVRYLNGVRSVVNLQLSHAFNSNYKTILCVANAFISVWSRNGDTPPIELEAMFLEHAWPKWMPTDFFQFTCSVVNIKRCSKSGVVKINFQENHVMAFISPKRKTVN
jgi:hypothetical protein